VQDEYRYPGTSDRHTVSYSISLALFVPAILTFVLVIRETFPLLNSEDNTSLRNDWVETVGFATSIPAKGIFCGQLECC
jgi:hypothetical protein